MTPNKLDGKKFSIFIFLISLEIFICETQILKVKRIKICKSNNPAKGGGLKAPQLVAKISFQSLLWDFIPVISNCLY
jgi:hypothetical protein